MNVAAIPREFKELPLGLVDEPELPSRSSMDEEKLDELTASIRAVGLQQPIVVARKGERFEVVAGHRRWHACKRAGLAGAPCIIYPAKDAALEAIKYAENRHREDLNPADEAIWFSELLERDCGGDVDVLCERLKEKRAYVEGRLVLFSGDPAVFEQLQAGQINIGIAQQLNKCSDERTRRYFLHQAIVGGATVAVVSGWITDWKREADRQAGIEPPPSSAAAPAPMPDSSYFECICCRGRDNVHLMRPVNVHDYCYQAILSKLLAAYHGDGAPAEQASDPRRI